MAKGIALMVSGTALLFIGIALIVIAAVLPGAIHRDVAASIHKDLDIVPGGASLPSWKSSYDADSPSIFMDFYMFNVTNPQEAADGKEPIDLKEVGPFRFQYQTLNLDPQWSDDEDIVSFVEYNFYTPVDPGPHFDRPITSLRSVFEVLKTKGLEVPGFPAYMNSLNYTNGDMLFVKKTPREILFDGYQDDFITELFKALDAKTGFPIPMPAGADMIPGAISNYSSPKEAMQKQGRIQMYTGKLTTYRSREYVTWNDQASLQCCSGAPCGAGNWKKPAATWQVNSTAANRIRGTEGSQFHSNIKRTDKLPIFVDQMFRSFDLVYESDTSIKGIDLYRFTLAAESLYNQTLNPNNAQYFVTGPSGLQPIGQCSQGLPLYISKPHFLDCSSSARSGLNIAKADRAKHDSYLDVEPITGATMNVAERLQASMLIGTKPADVKSSTFFPLVQPAFFPLFWLDKHGHVSTHTANKFKSSVYTANDASHDSKLGGYIAGPIIAVIGIVLFVLGWKRHQKHTMRKNHPMQGVATHDLYTSIAE